MLRAAMLSVIVVSAAHAADAGTPAEAEAMVKKVVAYMKANGAEKAFDEVTNGKSFKDRDLYAFIYDLNGKCLAHGANVKLVGKDLIGLKDPDGKLVIKIVMDLAKEKGKGWTEPVKFRNPTTDKLQTRVSYIERFGDYVIGSGVYKD
jgi:signal transduction histidine kinase